MLLSHLLLLHTANLRSCEISLNRTQQHIKSSLASVKAETGRDSSKKIYMGEAWKDNAVLAPSLLIEPAVPVYVHRYSQCNFTRGPMASFRTIVCFRRVLSDFNYFCYLGTALLDHLSFATRHNNTSVSSLGTWVMAEKSPSNLNMGSEVTCGYLAS